MWRTLKIGQEACMDMDCFVVTRSEVVTHRETGEVEEARAEGYGRQHVA